MCTLGPVRRRRQAGSSLDMACRGFLKAYSDSSTARLLKRQCLCLSCPRRPRLIHTSRLKLELPSGVRTQGLHHHKPCAPSTAVTARATVPASTNAKPCYWLRSCGAVPITTCYYIVKHHGTPTAPTTAASRCTRSSCDTSARGRVQGKAHAESETAWHQRLRRPLRAQQPAYTHGAG